MPRSATAFVALLALLPAAGSVVALAPTRASVSPSSGQRPLLAVFAAAETKPRPNLPLAVGMVTLYAPQRYIFNVTNTGTKPIIGYVLTWYNRGRVLSKYTDCRIKGEAPIKPGETRSANIELDLLVDVQNPFATAVWYAGGGLAGDSHDATMLPNGRQEQLHVYTAIDADIRSLRASGKSADAIAATLGSTPDKYAVRKSGDELYTSTRGVDAYKAVLALFKAQAASPNATAAVLNSIATNKASLLADGPLNAPVEIPPAKADPVAAAIKALPEIKPEVAEKLVRAKPSVAYTTIMRAARMQGTVRIQISVSPQGDVIDTKVLTSPNDLLSNSALNAVRNYKYNPYMLSGRPTGFQSTVDVVFHM